MLRPIISIAAFLLAQAMAQPGVAQGGAPGINLALTAPKHVHICTILSLDNVLMNFDCQTNRGVRKYWVARSTAFQSSVPNASFFRLKAGQPVQVVSHSAGRLEVADAIIF